MDLRVHEGTQVYTGGEGRFVFGVLGPDGKPLPPLAGDAAGGFTVIFEYELVATTTDQLRDWAQRWAGLGRFSVGSPDYLRALEGVTRRFTDRGQAPGKANGNALNQIRSNELALGAPWELREFTLTPTGLRPNPVAVTPDILALNGTPALAQLINDNETALLAGTFLLSESNEGASALAGPFRLSDFPNSSNRTFTAIDLVAPFYDVPWSAAGIRNNDARQAFALNTCGGCHRTETGAAFLQIGFPKGNQLPLRLGQPAALAGFLTGVTVPDPVVPTTSRSFADLKRRQEDFSALLGKLGPTTSSTTVMLPRHMPNFVH